MSKLYLDITQLLHWTGKLTGIPRVMHELTIRYMEDPEAEFVIWDKPSKSYVRVDVHSSLATRGKKITYLDKKLPIISPFFFTYRVLHKLRGYRFPVPAKVLRGFEVVGSVRKKQKFSKGDRLFVLWGELNDKKFTKEVVKLQSNGVGIIQASYDLLPLVTPQYSGHSTNGMAIYNKAVFPIADLVLAISEHTKTDITVWLQQQGVAVPSIKVFRLGDDFKLSAPRKPADSGFKAANLKSKEYLLAVGTIEARKNHALLYYVYKLAAQKDIELPKIVVVGRKGWLGEGVYELMKKDPLVKEKFVILEAVSDEELSWLYKNAQFSVYPSFYEGWGLPIAESIAHGTPCICSNTSSMPEVAGGLVDYFDPCSTDECLKKIQEFLNPVNLKEQTKKIKKYKPTSWDTTFKQVKQYIEEAYAKSN